MQTLSALIMPVIPSLMQVVNVLILHIQAKLWQIQKLGAVFSEDFYFGIEIGGWKSVVGKVF
jgi:hypothetical protein